MHYQHNHIIRFTEARQPSPSLPKPRPIKGVLTAFGILLCEAEVVVCGDEDAEGVVSGGTHPADALYLLGSAPLKIIIWR